METLTTTLSELIKITFLFVIFVAMLTVVIALMGYVWKTIVQTKNDIKNKSEETKIK